MFTKNFSIVTFKLQLSNLNSKHTLNHELKIESVGLVENVQSKQKNYKNEVQT